MLSGKNSTRKFKSNTWNSQGCLTIENMNPNVKAMEYVVRGPLYKRAAEIEKELKEVELWFACYSAHKQEMHSCLRTTPKPIQGKKKPFKKVLLASYGDCHGMGQAPMTYVRQVLAGVSYTPLLDDPKFPEDVKKRARLLLADCRGGSVGAYSDPGGIEIVRKHCAEYIANRDGYPSDWNDIILCSGASDGIKGVLKLLFTKENGKKSAILTPNPNFPFYSAVTAELGMGEVSYYLDEDNGWNVNIEELRRAIEEGRKTYHMRGIVVINPGNPAGQVFTKETLETIIKFSQEENLYIFADEVYQDNVYSEKCQFHSVKKVMMEMGEPYSKMQLSSFMSSSKGYMGECGLRGAYAEIINMCPQVRTQYMKSISAMLCPSVLGQVTIDCVVAPPKEGDPSYPLWKKEHDNILDSLRERAIMVEEAFRSVEGVTCNPAQGAMYAFPKLHLPEKFLRKAKDKGIPSDEFYASELLERTGIIMVPGSNFGMPEGSYRLRTTILPQIPELKRMLQEFKKFHAQILEEHS